MSTIMIRVPKQKTEELKGMVEQGLHIFGKVMNLCETMCDGEMGERYYGHREMDYPYGDRMEMRNYPPQYPYGDRWQAYGDRQGVPGTGRYSMYR